MYDAVDGGGSDKRAVSVNIRRPAALQGQLRLARALRPFKRPYRNGQRLTLDVEATVRQYADTAELVPVFQPALERWFTLDLVVDDAPSMLVWADVVEDLLRVFRQTGAFRQVQTWKLDLQGAPLLRDRHGRPAQPDLLRDPRARRLIVLLSDCVAEPWREPPVWGLIERWGSASPTALVNPLPPRLWRRTGMPSGIVRLSAGPPGAMNPRLSYRGTHVPDDRRASEDMTVVPLPTVGLHTHSIGSWASTVMGGTTAGCDGLLLPRPDYNTVTPAADASAVAFADEPEAVLAPADIVEAFRFLASPSAYRLALLASTQGVVSLPVLRLIQRELVPAADISDIAELVVSGMLEILPATGLGELLLRFDTDVRDELRQRLGKSDGWAARTAISRFLEHTEGRELTFTAAVPDPSGQLTLPSDLQPFADTSTSSTYLPANMSPAVSDSSTWRRGDARLDAGDDRPQESTLLAAMAPRQGGVQALATTVLDGLPMLVAAGQRGSVQAWDVASGRLLWDSPMRSQTSIVSLATGELAGWPILVGGMGDGRVQAWDLATGKSLGPKLTTHKGAVWAVSVVMFDGRPVVVSGSEEGLIQWSSLVRRGPSDRFVVAKSGVSSLTVASAADDQVVISGHLDGTVRIWDALTGESRAALKGHTAQVNALTVATFGRSRVLVSASDDRTVRLWRLPSGDPVGEPFVGHTHWVNAVAVGRSVGRHVLASGGRDGTVRLWDMTTGRALGQPLRGHAGAVVAVGIHEFAGQVLVVSAGVDGQVRLWPRSVPDGHSLAPEASPPNPMDTGAMVAWYAREAREGDVSAMLTLGNLLARADESQDLHAAELWYKRAASVGSLAATSKLADLLTRLEPPDLVAAQELAMTAQAQAEDLLGPRHAYSLDLTRAAAHISSRLEEASSDGETSATAISRPTPPSLLDAPPVSLFQSKEAPDLFDLLSIDDVDFPSAGQSLSSLSERALLRVPIGVDGRGRAVELDLKDSASGGIGPHGLTIGRPGSGKSEFLCTVVTGLALTHLPVDLALVLVDYHGIATFAPYSALPHVVYSTTDVRDEPRAMQGLRDVLAAELQRRQQILSLRGGFLGILDHRRRRLAGDMSLAPLPHLLIVVDEFNYVVRQPGLLDQLVMISRRGRALGVHLLLSAQWLQDSDERVQELNRFLDYRLEFPGGGSAESRDGGSRADGDLPPTAGLGLLKHGKSSVRVRIAHVRDSTRLPTAINHIVNTVEPRHQVSMPTLPSRVALAALLPPPIIDPERGLTLPARPTGGMSLEQVTAPIGIVEFPEDQRDDTFSVTLSGPQASLGVVGAPQTGKTTFLRTLTTSMCLSYTPDELQVYALDFGDELSDLAEWPHVGAVARSGSKSQMRRVATHLSALLDDRRRHFAEQRITAYADLRARIDRGDMVAGTDSGRILLIVDNWPAPRTDFGDLEVAVIDLALRGVPYGLHVAVSSLRWRNLPQSLLAGLGTRLELRLADDRESLFQPRAANFASAVPGRMLVEGGRIVQVALPHLPPPAGTSDNSSALEDVVVTAQRSRRAWRGPLLHKLPWN